MTELDPAETFRQEATDLLDELEQTLLDLETAPSDAGLIDAAFRALHTIKGSGAMFGFTACAAFTHDFETAFDSLRKSGAAPSRRLVEVALTAKDHIRSLIQAPDEADAIIGDAILADLRELVADRPFSPQEPGSGSESPETRYRLRFHFAEDVMINGTNPLMLLDELRALGPCTVRPLLDRLPPVKQLDPSACYIGWQVDLVTRKPRGAIDDVFMFVIDDMELEVTELEVTELQVTELQVTEAEAMDGDRDAPAGTPGAADEIESSAAPERARPGLQARATGTSPPAEWRAAQKPAPAAAARPEERGSATVRVQAERLDGLMDRVGELVIAQARLSALVGGRHDPSLENVAEEIERLAAGLRDTAMGLRMVPIGSLFSRFRRLVHDLSRDLSKPVTFITDGEDTELDKTMIERLADPLVHVIRNAIDHGVEPPETRAATDKDPTGTIRLSARHVGAEVQVSVSDDGRGLDLARIRAKGEEKGLIAAGAPATDSELVQLLFHPGFSTAREVSTLSGRGVGMDVVKRTIEAMRGTIDVVSKPGKGSCFMLRLPLTLAIIEGLLVRVADGRYIVPLSAIEECIELDRADDERSAGRSFLNVRGDLVPFIRLRRIFGEGSTSELHQKVVVVAAAERRIGLVVDQILGHHQTVIKSLSRLHADVGAFSGATIMADGLPALILDVGHLVAGGPAHGELRPSTGREAA